MENQEKQITTTINDYTTEELDNNFQTVNDNFKRMSEKQDKTDERFKLIHAELANRPGWSDIRVLEGKIANAKNNIGRIRDIQEFNTQAHHSEIKDLRGQLKLYRFWVYAVGILSFIDLLLKFLTNL